MFSLHIIKRTLHVGSKMTLFGLKYGQDLENRVAHSHQEFPGVPPRALKAVNYLQSAETESFY